VRTVRDELQEAGASETTYAEPFARGTDLAAYVGFFGILLSECSGLRLLVLAWFVTIRLMFIV
jgi:hypothetical protein